MTYLLREKSSFLIFQSFKRFYSLEVTLFITRSKYPVWVSLREVRKTMGSPWKKISSLQKCIETSNQMSTSKPLITIFRKRGSSREKKNPMGAFYYNLVSISMEIPINFPHFSCPKYRVSHKYTSIRREVNPYTDTNTKCHMKVHAICLSFWFMGD